MLGDHLVSCRYNGCTQRHSGVQDAFLRLLEGSRIPCSREQGEAGPEGNSRPADILLRAWSHGRDGALDLTISHPAQPHLYPLRVVSMQAHLRRAEERKLRKNGAVCQGLGWQCIPFAIDTWAGFGPSARGCFQQVLKRVTWGCPEKENWKRKGQVQQNLSLALMMGVGKQLAAAFHVQQGDPGPQGGLGDHFT